MNKHTHSVSLIDGHIEGMTDAEVIKALECCSVENCEDCKKDWSYVSQWDCMRHIMRLSLDLINRQQAEIEKLKAEKLKHFLAYEKDRKRVKSEAIKEFAERLKELTTAITLGGKYRYDVATKAGIDYLVKEMTEVNENG